MSTVATRKSNLRHILRNTALALVLATVAGCLVAGPALADNDGRHRGHERHGWRGDRDWGGHEWRGREWHAHQWHQRRGYYPYVYARPAYVYAPPPVVYAPPVYAPPSVSFVFPLGR
jgi:hypothetical protein